MMVKPHRWPGSDCNCISDHGFPRRIQVFAGQLRTIENGLHAPREAMVARIGTAPWSLQAR
jgi:hypothetical protein